MAAKLASNATSNAKDARPAVIPPSLGSPSSSLGTAPRPSIEPDLLREGYSLIHLELLHHFDHDLNLAFPLAQPKVVPLLRLAVREAFGRPYLMNELLALSAAHKSTLAGNEQVTSYRTEATRLQTRALARLDVTAQADISDDNCLALFLFSTFLGQQHLAAILDRFSHSLGLHRGIRAIAGRSWPRLSAQLQSSAKLGPEHGRTGTGILDSSGGQRGTECTALLELLRTKSQLAGAAAQACRDAVDALQQMFDSARPATTSTANVNRRFTVAQEWPVRVVASYVDLLDQRRPEALVILAYYGVLLHQPRDYWAVGDAGSYLVRSITRHLGTYWADWLRWPNTALDVDASGQDVA
ncbi:hypothetical protein VTI74DRAFT_8489 [Chaetomium olivicolor]